MKISAQILNVPPYISTSWNNILSLRAEPSGNLFNIVVTLRNNTQVTIPSVSKDDMNAIFDAHARYESLTKPADLGSFALPVSTNAELIHSALQHDPNLADTPEIPQEILEKITSIAKVLGLDESAPLPKAEPHCNCPFCQIAKAFHNEETSLPEEEIVADEDLKFRTWDIKQVSDKLFTVTNPLDAQEYYSVFLGNPLGCTCGQKNCEHIRAVLNS